jgi:hypothetical protein
MNAVGDFVSTITAKEQPNNIKNFVLFAGRNQLPSIF